jgi:hypothetical protein
MQTTKFKLLGTHKIYSYKIYVNLYLYNISVLLLLSYSSRYGDCIAGCMIQESEFDFAIGKSPFSYNVKTGFGFIQSPIQWMLGVVSPGVTERPGRYPQHSSPSSAEFKNYVAIFLFLFNFSWRSSRHTSEKVIL